MRIITCLVLTIFYSAVTTAQHHHDESTVDAQPLMSQAMRLREALNFLGSSLDPADEKKLTALQQQGADAESSEAIQKILDPYCLAVVRINPESRVKVDRGIATPDLMQNGWRSFLIKIYNDGGVTAALQPESPNALRPYHGSSSSPKVKDEDIISRGESTNRFLELKMYDEKPMMPHLSGLKLEYAILQIYCKDAGRREAQIGFNVGQGSQDVGFRNINHFLFNIRPAVKVKFSIKDDDGKPAMASLVIADSVERAPGRLSNLYPLPSRRVAAYDKYPDFFFQRQIYRNDGEEVDLPPGNFTITYSRGPEYIPQTKKITVTPDKPMTIDLQLKRWINMSKLGWYSGDHHVHAAGCSHYDSPEEGVPARDMWRQALGEDLNVSAVLSWGPSWYYQKQFFTGKDDNLSTSKNLMRYDVEVSGFPSSHSGHIVLLRLKEDDYPGTTKIEQWPSWTLPILKWAKAQGGIVGYAHSGWGLEPIRPTDKLPNYEIPKMDNIGANEYIVTVTQDAVDFYSLGDTPSRWELNMLYHTLNCGFRMRISGETDFPCITDWRVGLARSYFKSDKALTYDEYVNALKAGRSYMSDGGSHIIDFSVNGKEVGVGTSEIMLARPAGISVTAKIAAYLPQIPDDTTGDADRMKFSERSYWNIEWARIGRSRNIPVELIINGMPVDTAIVTADGKINEVNFKYRVERSCWAAMRILSSSHTNPIFIIVNNKPIIEKASAEWCISALDQCWKKKEPNIRSEEKAAAKEAYDKARNIYSEMVKSSN